MTKCEQIEYVCVVNNALCVNSRLKLHMCSIAVWECNCANIAVCAKVLVGVCVCAKTTS